ncbi:MAG TPA: LAGLIDADG family homing endonuclease [Candidatus Nanoarchaeia archaeon]|nr:LAGLIDADG family homing endonuclease [Candidatus Nanoarchaeia archaeon]
MKWDKQEIINEFKRIEKNLGRKPVKRDNANLYFLSRKHFGSWNNLIEKSGYKVRRFQNPQIPDVLSNEVYYLLGLLCTDGHIQFRKNECKYRLILFTSYNEEKEMIIKLIKNIFDYNASVREKLYGFSNRPNYEVYISSKKVCEFFNNLGVPYGNKSTSLRVPKVLFHLNKDKTFNFLRGVFDGDGSIIFSSINQTFKISSGSQKFIEDMHKLMSKLNINSSRITHERDNIWELKLNKEKEIKKLYNLLYLDSKFYYPRKKLKWSQRYI